MIHQKTTILPPHGDDSKINNILSTEGFVGPLTNPIQNIVRVRLFFACSPVARRDAAREGFVRSDTQPDGLG
jgi:hypothetical protein